MQKPIDDLNFWKERIDTAQKEHYSVYVTSERDWERINVNHLDIIDRLIKPSEKVLDAGCGYGRMANFFPNYTGVDFSPDFIARAKSKYPQKSFVEGNLKSLPFPDQHFDWAFCISIKKMVVDNLGETEWLLMENELKRVAKAVLLLEYEDPKIYSVICQ